MADPEKLQTRVRSVLEDPSAQAVARVYAQALLGAAESVEGGQSATLDELASFLDDILAGQPQFRDLLFSDVVSREDKLGLVDRVVAPHGSPTFVNFLRVLARHGRLNLLPLVLLQARQQYEHLSGRRGVIVRSARPLSEAQQHRIREQLQSSLPFEPVLHIEVEPALIGGLVIQIGDTVYDSSLRSRMKQLRGRLRHRSQNEIQRARDRFSH